MLKVIELISGRAAFKHRFFDFRSGIYFTCSHQHSDKHLLSTYFGLDMMLGARAKKSKSSLFIGCTQTRAHASAHPMMQCGYMIV